MPNTYSAVILHLVFAVKHRKALVLPHYRDELEKVICGLFQKHNQKVLAIYCMPDHAHILFDHRPSIGVADLVMRVKNGSASWINGKGFLSVPFHWQNGYGVFSCDPRWLDGIISYIMDQENHHRKQKFMEEYRRFLSGFKVNYDEKYLFEDITKEHPPEKFEN